MKKLLLATTMLVGAVAVAGGARAQATNPAVTASPFSVTLRGFTTFQFQNLNESAGPSSATVTPKQQTYKFSDQIRVSLLADAKADNGLMYGLFTRLDVGTASGTNTVTNNRSWAYVQGGWGKVYVGDRNTATDDLMGYSVGGLQGYGPATGDNFGPNGGIDLSPLVRTSYANIEALAGGYSYLGNQRQRQIRYDTPSIGGFYGSFMYAPTLKLFRDPNRNATVVTGDVITGGDFANHLAVSGYRDSVEGVAGYKGTIGPVGVDAAIGGDYAKAKGTAIGSSTQYNNFTAVLADARLTYAGFGLQLNFVDQFQSQYARRRPTDAVYGAPDQLGGGVGLSYTVGPYTVGGYWDAARDGGDPTVAGSNTFQSVGFGGHYIVAKGLMLFGGVDFVRFKGEGSSAAGTKVPNNSPTVTTVGTQILF